MSLVCNERGVSNKHCSLTFCHFILFLIYLYTSFNPIIFLPFPVSDLAMTLQRNPPARNPRDKKKKKKKEILNSRVSGRN